jgi:predicted hydrocarbon binding protein
MKSISPKDAMKVSRPVLGDTIPISLWRLLRLVAMPKVFGMETAEIDEKLGKEIGKLLSINKPEDIIDAIDNAQIGICNPMEKGENFYAIEFTECFTCSGITPAVGEPICDFEVAIIEGAFEKLGIKVKEAKETKCIGGLGDKVCRVEVKTA